MYYGYGSIDLKPVATWEVDGTGSVSRVPFSMYLLSGWQIFFCLTSHFLLISIKHSLSSPLFDLYVETKCHNSVI